MDSATELHDKFITVSDQYYAAAQMCKKQLSKAHGHDFEEHVSRIIDQLSEVRSSVVLKKEDILATASGQARALEGNLAENEAYYVFSLYLEMIQAMNQFFFAHHGTALSHLLIELERVLEKVRTQELAEGLVEAEFEFEFIS
mgnify:CR=1 FL=1